MNVHNSFVWNSQILETNYPPLGECLNTKEETTDAPTTWTDTKGIMMSEKACLRRSHTLWFHLYNMAKRGKAVEMENRLVIAKG